MDKEYMGMDKNLYEIVTDVLKTSEKYQSDDGKLLKAVIYTDAITMNRDLLSLLLSDDRVSNRFFKKVNDILVFDKQEFVWFIESKEFLPDSYTKYTNKIGLTRRHGDFISKSNDVVLDFPYKDCVLQGGQDKEDQKREEIFYNEIIASEDITRLLSPKVFTNIKRYKRSEVETNVTFTDSDNMLIKGNNLLTLSSLVTRYEGKIKCIYIDPPYNTGSDSFKYNDSFNQSSWLLFMKNRLEFAKRLLSEDGTIAISIDNYEIAYILVLLDEIFGKDNRKNIITVRRASVSGAKVINPGVVNIVEYIVIYSKNTNYWKPNRVYAARGYDERYNKFIENVDDDYKKWTFTTVLEAFAKFKKKSKGQLKRELGSNYEVELENFVIDNCNSVIQFASLNDSQISNDTLELKKLSLKSPDEIFFQEREGYKDYYIKDGKVILFAKDRIIDVDGKKTFSIPVSDIWDDVLPNDIHNEGGVELKKGKKPEKLISRIVELCTNKDDLVLDFFAGSGTTGAVCLKLKRRFILCEQMDYIEDITKTRLINTVKGDSRGISSDTNWSGGESFIYCELLENANSLIKKIQDSTEDNIDEVKMQIYSDKRIIPYITKVELGKADEMFAELSLENKKKILIELINKNKLYVNYSDLDDDTYAVKDGDKIFTKSFYKES